MSITEESPDPIPRTAQPQAIARSRNVDSLAGNFYHPPLRAVSAAAPDFVVRLVAIVVVPRRRQQPQRDRPLEAGRTLGNRHQLQRLELALGSRKGERR